MAETSQRISAEIENIENILVMLGKVSSISKASSIELAGIGAFLHNFYNAVENIIKQVLVSKNVLIPTGAFWHRELLDAACNSNVLSAKVKEELGPYLAFRHFFVHGYSVDLRADLISPLVTTVFSTYRDFKEDLVGRGIIVQ